MAERVTSRNSIVESPHEKYQLTDTGVFAVRRRFRAPIWSLFVALSTLSLVVVGVVVYVLTRFGAVAAIDSIGESYRSLACTVVENEVMSFMGTMEASTKQLVNYAAHSAIAPGLRVWTVFCVIGRCGNVVV